MLGVGEKTYRQLVRKGQLRYVLVGRRRKHAREDVDEYIKQARAPCPSNDAKGHHTGGTTSRSTVVGFEEARKRMTTRRRK